ncbi:hypothetical protein JRO89_XS02G0185600 [Xanthoceras sorbifolium]|uniref:C-JID domain-containing protein n=1 Tax=Xanthoceras sorbifolium TaxID=99658 RepID=A0ABQ8IG48_9ROSI|nr:hypothetical protein JRO89_XS02G0185600 [Xanthoceras sorbifolium]
MHDNGMIKMHDLLREMGREIVHEESPKKPGNRSRLWKNEDVLRTLKDDNGTAAVQGIILDSTTIKDVQLSSQVFEKMCNLRILIIKKLDKSTPNLSNGLDYLPHELRYLSWDSYPLEALPSSFNPENLVELNLSYSNIEQLWEGTKLIQSLPDESEFELYVDGGGSMKFIFVNCLKLNLKAVSDVFGESLLKLQVMAIEKVSSLFKGIPFRGICDIPLEQHEKEVKVSICLPGSEIPEWFCYQNSGSSINIPRLQHDCGSSRYIMGFALCLVIRFEESYFHPYDALTVDYDFHIENSDGHEEAVFHDSFPLFPVVSWDKIKTGVSIDLDHIFLGYAFSPKYYDFFQKLDALPTNHGMSDYLGASFEFNLLHHCSPLDVEACKVKHCGVYPIYVKVDSVEELKNIAINQDTGGTS